MSAYQALRKGIERQAGFAERLFLFTLFFAVGFLILRLLGKYAAWLFPAHLGFFGGISGAYLGAGMTLFLAYIAWEQLRDISETTSAQFLLQLKKDLFTTQSRVLFHLFEFGWITFRATDEKNTAWFEVNVADIERSRLPKDIQEQLLKKKIYSTYEIDDWILGHLEDVGLLLKRRILKISVVYEEFSTYYGLTLKSSSIQKYLAWLRLDSYDFYDNLEYAAQKCKEYEVKKQNSLVS